LNGAQVPRNGPPAGPIRTARATKKAPNVHGPHAAFHEAPRQQTPVGEGRTAVLLAHRQRLVAHVEGVDAPAAIPGAADRFWDGAISGCNNPAVAAVVESAVLGHSPQDLRVLSLGTGTVSLPLALPGLPPGPLEAVRPDSSLTTDLKKLATAIFDDPPDAATFIAHAMTGGNAGLQPPVVSRVVRMSPLMSPFPAQAGGWMPPTGWSVAQFQHLCNIDMDAVVQTDVGYIDDYCSFWLQDRAPNQPIRANGTAFDPRRPEIGYASFSAAQKAWDILFPVIGLGV